MVDFFLIIVLILVFLACIFFGMTFFMLIKTKVPYVPTSKKIAKEMIGLADLKKGQKIYDLGCGDGRILFLIEKQFGQNFAELYGYELIKPLVKWNQFKNWRNKGNIEFLSADFFTKDLTEADIIFTYLWPSVMDKFFEEKWSTLKKDTKLVSHAFRIKKLTPISTKKVGRSTIFIYEKN